MAALFQVVMILRSAACTSVGMIAVHYILRRSMPSQPGLMIACPGIPPFQRLGNPGEDQRIGHSLEIVCRFGGSWEARVGKSRRRPGLPVVRITHGSYTTPARRSATFFTSPRTS